ncbi:MAG: hypothetical protein VXY74_02785 [SAR324 cluster bacterium]|nr:hypothetical protein [SAR324 cluster bacterium]
MNCTADVRSDHCEIWVPTQFPEVVCDKAAEITGLEPEQVTVTLPTWVEALAVVVGTSQYRQFRHPRPLVVRSS